MHLCHTARRRPVAVGTLAALGLAVAVPAALAGSYEQVTRATGANGAATFASFQRPVAVSDNGRYGVYRAATFSDGDQGQIYVRDIRSNETRPLLPGAFRVDGFDRGETHALVERQSDPTHAQIVLVGLPGGTAPKVLATYTSVPDTPAQVSAAISGDGKTVVVAEAGVPAKVWSLPAGTVKTLPDTGLGLGPRSLSDDGRVIAATLDLTGGVVITGNTRTLTPRPAIVSPDGKTAAYASTDGADGAPTQVAVRTIATGAVKLFDDPASTAGGELAWIAPDGSAVAVAPQTVFPGGAAQVVDVKTGVWKPFGGAAAGGIRGDVTWPTDPGTAVFSRSGRYALVNTTGTDTGQEVLLDTAGGDLIGDQESLSAASYVNVTPLFTRCGRDAQVHVTFGAPALWLPVPRSATVTVTIDGKPAISQSMAPGTAVDFTLPAAAKSVAIDASVVDAVGKTVHDQQTTAPFCFG